MAKALGQIRKFKRLPEREDVVKHIEAAKAAHAFWEATLALMDKMAPPPEEQPLPFRETA